MLMETPGLGHNSEMACGNWIAVDRDIRTHEVVGFLNEDGTVREDVIVCETMAWIDLIMQANFRDRKTNNKGRPVIVERGQLIGGRAWLAQRWGWTEKKVRYFLQKLKRFGMIETPPPKYDKSMSSSKSGPSDGPAKGPARRNTANVITICKYDIYQTVHELDDLMWGQQPGQPKGQRGASEGPHENKGTREQEDKSSVPIGTGAAAPAEHRDFRKILWEDGLAKLREYSTVDEIKLRRRVGRWVKDYSPGAVIDAILKADKEQPVDALSWIEAVLRRNHGEPGDNLAPWERKAKQDNEETKRVLAELKAEKEKNNG